MLIRLVKLSVSALVALCDAAVRARLRLRGRPVPAVQVVLYYHAVRAAHRASFARQMDHLIRRSTPVPARCDGDREPDHLYTSVTFDDGFVSVVENALPALRSRGIPCTIFVPTGSVGRVPAWIGPDHPDAGELVADAAMIRALAQDALVEIGSHSVSHPRLPAVDGERARDELEASKRALEAMTGRRIRSFSFPHGAHSERDVELARRAGYERVFTIEPLPAGEGQRSFVVGRVRVEPDDWRLEFRLKLVGAYRWLPRLAQWRRRVGPAVGFGRARVGAPVEMPNA